MKKKFLGLIIVFPLILSCANNAPTPSDNPPQEVVASLSEIRIASNPTKLTYEIGEELDLSGLVVKAIYSDNSEKEITNYQVTGFDSSSDGDKTITITYEDKSVTFTVHINPEVIVLSSITITSSPTKLEYIEGEELDISGLVVKAIYSDDSEEIINDYVVSGYDPSLIGSQTITISYQGKTTSFVINVIEKEVPIVLKDAERIYLPYSATSLIKDTTYDLKPVVIPEGSYKNVKYLVDDSNVLSIDNNVATALEAGSAILTAYNDNNDNGVKDTNEPSTVMSFLVNEPEEGVSLTMEQDIVITAGETRKIEYTLEGKSGETFNFGFRSNNSKVADFANGNLVAYNSGECEISVSFSGYKATSRVTVIDKKDAQDNILPTRVNAKKQTINLNVNDTKTFEYDLYPINAKQVDLFYEVSDPSIISIENNQIHALKEGSALLYVATNEEMNNKETVIINVSDSSKTYRTNYYDNYYGDLTWENGEDLKEKLHNIIVKDKTSLKYNTPNWETNQNADVDLYDLSLVATVYGRNNILKTGTGSGWQREHAFAASLMTCTTTGNAVKTLGRATDFHNLYAAYASGNSSRGNKNLGNANPIAPDYTDRDTYAFTREYFEPISEVDKGKLARAIFYMGVMYNEDELSTFSDGGINFSVTMPKVEIVEDLIDYNRLAQTQFTSPNETNTPIVEYYRSEAKKEDGSLDGNNLLKASYEMYMGNALPYAIGNLSTLLEWNAYAVSQEEMHHNESVYSYNSTQGGGRQNNRNPFVDYPELVDYIYGDLKYQSGKLSDLRPTSENLEMEKSGVHHYALGENMTKDYKVGDTVTAESLDLYAVNNDLSITKVSGNVLDEYTFRDGDEGDNRSFTFRTDKNDIEVKLNVASESFVPFKDRVQKATTFDASKTYYLSSDGINFATNSITSSALNFVSVESNIAKVNFTLVEDDLYKVEIGNMVLGYSTSTSLKSGGTTTWRVTSHNGGFVLVEPSSGRFVGLTASGATTAKAYAASNLGGSKYPAVYLYIEK